jgi:hypothetical protein
VTYVVFYFDHAVYDRSELDQLLGINFGSYGVRDALTDDLFLIAYSYNNGIPRFYTKAVATDP